MQTVQFLPAELRDFDGPDGITQRRVTAALKRFAATGHGDVKRFQDRSGEFRLRVGKWHFDSQAAPVDCSRVAGTRQSTALIHGVRTDVLR